MERWARRAALTVSGLLITLAGCAPPHYNYNNLLARLGSAEMSDQEATQIVFQARAQRELREELSQRLPGLLEKTNDRSVLFTEAKIAGDLELASTASDLAHLLRRPDTLRQEPSTLTGDYLLEPDPIAQALAEIGFGALPALAASLRSQDVMTRSRAASVLVLMHSRSSFFLLRLHSLHEPDSSLRGYIEANLRS